MRVVILALVHVLVATVPSMAAGPEKVRVPSRAGDTAEINAYLLRPAGPGLFPAVLALHGCSGLWNSKGALSSRHADWGERFRAAGYVVLFPDSFGSRGHQSLCKTQKWPVKPAQRAGDVQGAADWLAERAFVDPKKIVLLGWSNGGTSLLTALAPDKAPAKTDFLAAIAFYPSCRHFTRSDWKPRIKPLILMGAADDWTPAAPCQTVASRWDLRLVLYEGAYHNFDAPDMPVRVLKGRAYTANNDGKAHVGTDLLARAAAIEEVMTTLKAAFAADK